MQNGQVQEENVAPKRVINFEQGLERWEGRVAVVTGASSPIGKAICETLVMHGLIVCGLATRTGKYELEVSIKDVKFQLFIRNYFGKFFNLENKLILILKFKSFQKIIFFKFSPNSDNEQKVRERKFERKASRF